MTDTTAGEEVQAMARTLYKADEDHGPIRMNLNFEQLRWHDRLRYEQMARTVIAAGGLAAQPSAGAQGLSDDDHAVIQRCCNLMPKLYQRGSDVGEYVHSDIADLISMIGRATPAQPDTGDVAALREALGDAVCALASIAGLAQSAVKPSVAALSKPNAPGAA